MNDSLQPRRPIGRPDGGQFAAMTRPESDVTLAMSDADYNRTGTFLFPPAPRNAQQHLSFWAEVEVDDAVLENVSLGYERWAFAWHQAKQNEWLETEYFPQHRIDRHKFRAGAVPVNVQHDVERAAEEYSATHLDAIHPRKISPLDARTVARAGQSYYFSGALSEEDAEIVEHSLMSVEGAQMEVAQIVDRYALSDLRPWFSGTTRALVEGLDEVRQATDRLAG